MNRSLLMEATGVLVVKNEMGIHTRPAARIVAITKRYADTEVRIIHKNKVINGKSILGIMTLGAKKGAQLIITAKGLHAQKVIKELTELFEEEFGNSPPPLKATAA